MDSTSIIVWVPVADRLPDVDKNPDTPFEVAHVMATDGCGRAFPVFFERTTLKRGTVYRWRMASGPLYYGPPIIAWADYPSPPPFCRKKEESV